MCTMFISFEPDSAVPMLLLFARDEQTHRDWLDPGQHWPRYPTLTAPKDVQSGGTWLAASSTLRTDADGDYGSAPRICHRTACILNGFGQKSASTKKSSRGELPLRAATGERIESVDVERYDPFHLVVVDSESAFIHSWTGHDLVTSTSLASGTHIVTNNGLETGSTDVTFGGIRTKISRRVEYFRSRLAEVSRPNPLPATKSIMAAWNGWLELANGDGLNPDDPRALVLNHASRDGTFWVTSSVSLIAHLQSGMRFDFNGAPLLREWRQIAVGT
jgi:uncharacterized protein with NRDE domain